MSRIKSDFQTILHRQFQQISWKNTTVARRKAIVEFVIYINHGADMQSGNS